MEHINEEITRAMRVNMKTFVFLKSIVPTNLYRKQFSVLLSLNLKELTYATNYKDLLPTVFIRVRALYIKKKNLCFLKKWVGLQKAGCNANG